MPWNPMLPGTMVCVCHMVGHDAARDAVLSGKVTTYAEFKRNSPAGSNCTLCDPYFERIISMYLMVRDGAAGARPNEAGLHS